MIVDVAFDPNPPADGSGDDAQFQWSGYQSAPGETPILTGGTINCYVNACTGPLLAHEIGHVLGLGHAEASCGDGAVMSRPTDASDFSDACTSADNAWDGPSENSGSGPDGPDIPTTCHNCSFGGKETLVLDLNGDGILTTGVDQTVLFDLDADGRSERLTWLREDSGDAFLWLDLNNNQIVDGGREVFGIGTTLTSGQKAANGFEALSAYDSPIWGGNSDGRISQADRVWGRLKLWLDANADGQSSLTETAPIHRYGVTVLHLNYKVDASEDVSGNIHLYRSNYWRNFPGDRRRALLALHGLVFQEVE